MFLAALIAIVAPLVSGQEMIKVMSGDKMRVLLAAMDFNTDKAVSLEEGSTFVQGLRRAIMQQQSQPILDAMDTSKDGFLSLAEYKEDLRHFNIDESRKEDYAKRFKSFDDDGDNLLSEDEVLALFNFMFPFQQLDANHDGLLSMREFKQIARDKLASAPQHEIERSNQEAKIIFAGLDANGDRRIDAKEHFAYHSGIYAGISALKKLFELADANGDGLLSEEELVEVRGHPQFGGSAAYHHSKDWIEQVEQMVRAQREATSAKAEL